jgi:glycosyltransferase involved in cell wall biosynthesis
MGAAGTLRVGQDAVGGRPSGPSVEFSLLLPSLAAGGAESNLVALANQLHLAGRDVELVLVDARGPLTARLVPGLRTVDLRRTRIREGLPSMVTYLRRRRPACLLATVEHANVLALVARRVAGVRTRVVVRVATRLGGTEGGQRAGAVDVMARWCYPSADGIVANSPGAAAEIATALGVERRRVEVLPNLTVTPELLSDDSIAAHPWYSPEADVPIIVSVARLDATKNLPLLLDAFALVRRERVARLVLVGDGELRTQLESQVAMLGIGPHVAFVGHQPDPAPYVRGARVFCLSSDVEGMPNAMIEAMALGVGVVATDCRNGPRDLLRGGRYGRLVPVGDRRALAAALQAALDDPRPAPPAAWVRYEVGAAARRYEAYLDAVLAGASRLA